MSALGWDYPPGVTGNEREIAGNDSEFEAERECTSYAVYTALGKDGQRIEVEADCPFVGEVTVAAHRAQEFWVCPLCGAEHNEEVEGPE